MTKPISPILPSESLTKIISVPAEKIISLYKNEYGIDVQSYFKDITKVDVLEGVESKYRFYYPFGLAGNSDFYSELQKNSWYYSSWRFEHAKSVKYIKDGDNVLEIGCGNGFFLEKIKAKYSSVTVEGIELNRTAALEGKKKGISISYDLIEEYKKNNFETKDVICFFQVLEHIEQPMQFLNDVLSVLKKGGILIFAVPNNNPFLYGYDIFHTLNLPPHHSGLWNKDAVRHVANFLKVDVVNLETDVLSIKEKELAVQKALSNKSLLPVRNGNMLRILPLKWSRHYFKEGRNLFCVLKKLK